MKINIKKCIVAGIMLSIIAIVYASGLLHYVTFDQLTLHRAQLKEFVEKNYFVAVFLYISLYTLFEACALPAAAILTLSGGFLFGAVTGALYTNIGATAGATCAFLAVRYLVGDYVQARYKKQLTTFNSAMHQYGPNYLLVVHFIALIPFFVVNILAACTDISLWTFIWTTSVGIIPGSLVYSYAGQQLSQISSGADIFSWKLCCAFALLALLALLPIFIQKFFLKKDA